MEFNEHQTNRPFSGVIAMWRAWQKWRLREQTRRILSRMSDDQLRDLGLTRYDARRYL
jgi:uncharacterized protein YjiS (DUF1127 family)